MRNNFIYSRSRQSSSKWLVTSLALVLAYVSLSTGNPLPEHNDHICYKKPGSNIRILKKDASGYYSMEPSDETSGTYTKAAVAASSIQCADVGAKMFKKGGSAVDAAIATLLCDGVVSLQG